MFELITVHEGTRYHYAIHKGEKKPSITPLDEEYTGDPSGTEVKIIIKDGDEYKVKDAVKTHLKYFDNINYIGFDIDNDYEIIKGKHFIHRVGNDKNYQHLHMCLGNVYYPIDFNVVTDGRTHYFPAALKFDIGEIPVVWNRENVEYTEKAITKIQEKIDLLKEEMEDLYSQHQDNINDIGDFLTHSKKNHIVIHHGDDKTYTINDYHDFIDKNKYYKKYKHLKVYKNNALFTGFRKDRQLSSSASYTNDTLSHDDLKDNTCFLVPFGHTTSSLKDEYIKSLYGDGIIIRKNQKKKTIREFLQYYYRSDFIANPYKYIKEYRQQAIKEAYDLYDEIMDYVEDLTIDYTSITVPDSFIESYNKKKEEYKLEKEQELFYMSASMYNSFTEHRINGTNVKQTFGRGVVIYGFQADRGLLRKVKRMISNEYKYPALDYIHVIQISKKNERVLTNELKKVYHVKRDFKKIPFIDRISNKYNYLAWKFDLKDLGLDVKEYKGRHTIPNYVTPQEPSLEEKKQLYKQVGNNIKYPLLRYLSHCPREKEQEYMEQCPLHPINPILIGKHHVKDYENKRNQKQQSSNSDTGS